MKPARKGSQQREAEGAFFNTIQEFRLTGSLEKQHPPDRFTKVAGTAGLHHAHPAFSRFMAEHPRLSRFLAEHPKATAVVLRVAHRIPLLDPYVPLVMRLPKPLGALSYPLETGLKLPQFLRAQFRKDLFYHRGVLLKDRNDYTPPLFCERDDSHAPVVGAIGPAHQPLPAKAIDGDANRSGRQFNDRSDCIYGQRPFVQQRFEHPKVGISEPGIQHPGRGVPGEGAHRLEQNQPSVDGRIGTFFHK
jgi:hypothetical protein